MMLRRELSNKLKQSGSANADPVVIVVPDHAHRPMKSVSESSWSEVPALCRHRGRQASARSLKTRTLVCRWGGSQSVQGAKADPIVQKYPQQQQQEQQIQQHRPKEASPSATTNSSKPRRKASLDVSTQDIDHFQRSRNLCMPMRKASIDMVTPDPSQLTGLKKPVRKASVDMNVDVTSSNVECFPNSSQLGSYRYMSSEGAGEGHSSSASSDGDGCMIDLIRPRSMHSEEVQEDYTCTDRQPTKCMEEEGHMENDEDDCEEELGDGTCMLDHVLSMPRRSNWNNETASNKEDYGYTEHQPTPRNYDDCCCQTEPVRDCEATDCMINMVRNRVHHQQLVVKAPGRPQRKASIDMCGIDSTLIDIVGLQARQGSSYTRQPARRTSRDMIGVDMANFHLSSSTVPEVQ